MRTLVLALLLTACGHASSGDDDDTPTYSVPLLDPAGYSLRFEELAHKYLKPDFKVTTTITMSNDLKSTIAALCHMDTHSIEINAAVWDAHSGPYREQVMFHELGHCELKRNHLDTQNAKLNYYTSLMYGGGGLDEQFYVTHADYYQQELFSIVNTKCDEKWVCSPLR